MSVYHRGFVTAFVLASGCIPLCALSAAEPPQQKRARLDRFGDPLPKEVLYRVGAARFRLGRSVSLLTFSKDGKTLHSVSGDAIRHWDAVSGKQLREIVLRDVSNPVALSPDGTYLAKLSERYTYKWANTVGITDASTGRFLHSLKGRGGSEGIAFAPDNRTLAAADDEGTIYLWDVASGKALGEWKGGASGGPLAFSPDGKVLAGVHANGVVRLWDVSGRRTIRRIQPVKETEFTDVLTFSPDGKLLAACDSGEIRLWNTATGRRLQTIRREGHSRSALTFSPDGKTIAADNDYGVVCLWDVADGKEIRRLGRRVDLHSLAFSPDGAFLAAGEDNIRLYRVANGEEVRPVDDGSLDLDNAVFTPDGRLLLTAGTDGFIRLWDADTGAPVRRFKGRPEGNSFVGFSKDGKSLFTHHELRQPSRNEERFCQWNLLTGEEQRCIPMPPDAVCMALSSSGRILAWANKKGVVHIRDVATGKERRSWQTKAAAWSSLNYSYVALRFSAQDKFLGIGNRFGGQCEIREVETGAECSFSRKRGEYFAFSPDGRVAAHILPKKRNNGIGMQWRSPDDERLIDFQDTTSGESLARTDLQALLALSFGDSISAEATVFAPDGRTFATAIKGQPIRFWETATGKERYRLTDGNRNIEQFSFGLGGGRYRRPDETGNIEQFAFAPDGNKLVLVGAAKIALVCRVFGPAPGSRPLDLSARRLQDLWADLASADGQIAFRAIRALTASPHSAVELLRREVPSVPRLDPQDIARWIAELDADDFGVREKAVASLGKHGLAIEGALKTALRQRPTLEARRRMEGLLDKMKTDALSPQMIRTWRAVEALEHMATPEARRLLEEWAKGEPEARLTHEAKASLERLARSSRVVP